MFIIYNKTNFFIQYTNDYQNDITIIIMTCLHNLYYMQDINLFQRVERRIINNFSEALRVPRQAERIKYISY